MESREQVEIVMRPATTEVKHSVSLLGDYVYFCLTVLLNLCEVVHFLFILYRGRHTGLQLYIAKIKACMKAILSRA